MPSDDSKTTFRRAVMLNAVSVLLVQALEWNLLMTTIL